MGNFEGIFQKLYDDYPELRCLFITGPAYFYYTDKKGNRYFYTKAKINHKGKERYVAGIYRFIKTKNQFKLVKSVGFAKKKKAIAWAEKECNKAMGWD